MNLRKMLAIALIAFPMLAMADRHADNTPNGRLIVEINDASGSDTNIRQSPGGKLACKLPADNTYHFVLKDGIKSENGWVRIADGEVFRYAEDAADDYTLADARIKLTGSTTGYWIHSSLLEIRTLAGADRPTLLRSEPSKNAPVAYGRTKADWYRPLQRQGNWVLMKTWDGKYQGWEEMDQLWVKDLFASEDCECDGEPYEYACLWPNELNQAFYLNGTVGIESVVNALCLTETRWPWDEEQITMDRKGGYFSFFEEGDGSTQYQVTYWKREDGRVLVMMYYRRAEPFYGEVTDPADVNSLETHDSWYHFKVFTLGGDGGSRYLTDEGIMAWLYNAKTHMLEPMGLPPFNAMPQPGKLFRRYELPQQGKDIMVTEYDPADEEMTVQKTYTLKFNGLNFNCER